MLRQSLVIVLLFVIASCDMTETRFPLRINEDHRYLVDHQNKPFPILGRTAWVIISQSEENYKKFIENTLSYGYNAIEFAAITHWPNGNRVPFNGEGEAPFTKSLDGSDWNGNLKYGDIVRESPDLTTPNEKYWRFVDTFLGYCESKGLLVFMFPAYLGYNGEEQGWMKELVANGPERSFAYGAWVAQRYRQRKNIVWMLLGDMGKFNEQQRIAEQALIDGLKSIKGQQSSQYSAESHSGENAADNPFFGHEMTLNGAYTWELRVPVPYLGRKAYAYEPHMPAFLLEEPYDEEGPDGNNFNPNATQPVRRFQWWGWLSTIGGYVAGNGYVWPFVDPQWQKHLDTNGTQDMWRLNCFINSIEWWKLVPAGLDGMKDIIMDTPNSDTTVTYISAAAARDGSLLVAYIPPAHTGVVTVDLSVLSAPGFGYWFDLTDGSYRPVEPSPRMSPRTVQLTTPGTNRRGDKDWVLLFTASTGFPSKLCTLRSSLR